MPKERIDVLLVAQGLAATRAKAQALLMAGQVLVDDRPVSKVGTLFSADASIRLRDVLPYVGRGGIKLAYALDSFCLSPLGNAAADIGASTGGFTDCLLQRGAVLVYAIDVGHSQLEPQLRADPRVVVMDHTNARRPFELPQQVSLVTIDVSFISATLILPGAARILAADGDIVVLVKPQFEAGPGEVGKGGVIKDPLVHARVLARFIAWAAGHHFRLHGLATSPVTGASGNKEFFAWLRPGTR